MKMLLTYVVVSILHVFATASAAPVTVPVAIELSEDGDNYDDPCFWQDPSDADRYMAFMTSKDDSLVDVWELPSGIHLGQIRDFIGYANNCAIDRALDLLVTTDPQAQQVLVHTIPDLALVIVIDDALLKHPSGVAVGHTDGTSYAFVTDESSKEVHVFRLPDGTHAWSFPYNLSKAEGISADDDYQQLYVSDDKSNSQGTKVFTFAGVEIQHFGIQETGSDSEGNAIYRCGPDAGYIIVSDQRQNDKAKAFSEFEVFDRMTFSYLGNFRLQAGGSDWTGSTDGIDVFQGAATAATGGIFAACDGCGQNGQSRDQLDIVGWDRIAEGLGLLVCPNGIPPNPPIVANTNAGFTTMMDIQLSGKVYCHNGTNFGILDEQDSGKLKVSGTATFVLGTGSNAGATQGTLIMNFDPAPVGPGPITFHFTGTSLAKNSRTGFFQLDANSAGGSDLLITGDYSISKFIDQVKSTSALWQGEINENGFDCFGSGKMKTKVQ